MLTIKSTALVPSLGRTTCVAGQGFLWFCQLMALALSCMIIFTYQVRSSLSDMKIAVYPYLSIFSMFNIFMFGCSYFTDAARSDVMIIAGFFGVVVLVPVVTNY